MHRKQLETKRGLKPGVTVFSWVTHSLVLLRGSMRNLQKARKEREEKKCSDIAHTVLNLIKNKIFTPEVFEL